MAFALRCPECRQAFKWEPTKPDPRHCPLCEADLGEPPGDNVIAIPAFLSAKTKAGDAIYRQAEAASEVRAEKAAELAGCDVSEMSSLKITDMRSTKHAGDIAAMPVVNDVTRQMDAVNARGGQFGFAGGNGAEFAAGISTGTVTVDGQTTHGIEPRAGAKTLGAIQRQYTW
jgi:3-deoxy-D-manno-octulosonic acid (KDO) 8-phosphate synthase